MRRVLPMAAMLVALLTVPALAAAPYPPPSDGQGSANPSRVKQGNCTQFSGDGFAAATAISITDDGSPAGTTTSDDRGRFRARVCFANDARVGEHVLRGRGAGAPGGPAQHEVTATVTVTGLEQSGGGNGNGPRTTAAAGVSELVTTPFGLALLGLLVVPLLSGLLLALDRRHRARRTTA